LLIPKRRGSRHQNHADEKRFRDEAIAQLQAEHGKIQNRLDKLYEDRLDGFIEPAFFERKAQEWRQAQKRLMDQKAEHLSANHNYIDDGVRLLELARKAYFLFKKQNPSEKTSIAGFRVFELHMEARNTDCYIPPTL
jgi:site-specific DNA recombinase